MPIALRQFALQAVAVLFVLPAALLFPALDGPLFWGLVAAGSGMCAGLLAWLTGQPPWWRFIHGAFLPLAWAVNALRIPPDWFLLAFVVLMLVYRGAVTGRVPLYLSNAATATRLAILTGDREARHLVDLGAGIGSIVRRLAKARPAMAVTGIENAPLTWLVGGLLSRWRGTGNVDWRYGSLWDIDLGRFDVVYAFLSPEPMPALWEKVRAEMAPGSLLVSNSFPVPDVEPSSRIEVGDRRGTVLYCYAL